MKIVLAIFFFSIILSGCGKQERSAPQGTSDSLLSTPLDPERSPVPVNVSDSVKPYVDMKRLRTPEHQAIMKRFTPDEVVRVYHDFRPLRKQGVTSETAEVRKFLADHTITLTELKAILEEGDRLGWSKAK